MSQRLFTIAVVVIGVVLVFGSSEILGQPNIHYTKDHQKLRLNAKDNTLEVYTFRQGFHLNDFAEKVSLYYNELETVSGIKYLDDNDNWKPIKNKKQIREDIEGQSFFNGLSSISFHLPKSEFFSYAYKLKNEEPMSTSILPLFTDVPTDSLLYEFRIPADYQFSYQLDGVHTGFDFFDITEKFDEITSERVISIISVTGNQRLVLASKPVVHYLIHPENTDPDTYLCDWYQKQVPETDNPDPILSFIRKSTLDNQQDDPSEAPFLLVSSIVRAVHKQIRYIDFENGRWAFQPRPVNKVLRNKFGDCKDMNNLVRTALNQEGIEAYLGLCSTQRYLFNSDFPGLQAFNHVVCLVRINNEWYVVDATHEAAETGQPFGEYSQNDFLIIGHEHLKWLDAGQVNHMLPRLLVGKEPYWENHESIDLTQVPPRFRNTDVLIIDDKNHMAFNMEKGQLFVKETMNRMYKVLSEKGLEATKTFSISPRKRMKITSIKAKTIKPDGTEIEVEPDAIKSLTKPSGANGQLPTEIWKFAIPGTAIGDQIELQVQTSGFFSTTGDQKFFFESFPVLKSTFSVTVDHELAFLFKEYNGLEPPVVLDNIHSKTYKWSINYIDPAIPGFTEDAARYQPYLMYDFHLKAANWSSNHNSDNWLDLLKAIHQKELRSIVRKPYKMKEFYHQILDGRQRSTASEKAKHFHQFVNENIKVTAAHFPDSSTELDDISYSLKVSEIGLVRFYKDFFERNGIPYFLAVAKKRKNALLDIDFPSRQQIDRLFFVVSDDEGSYRLFLPKKIDSMLKVDELPSELEGAQVLMFNPKDKKKIHRFELPFSQSEVNLCSKKGKLEIKLEAGKLYGENRTFYRGHPSIRMRSKLKTLEKESHVFSYLQHKVSKTFSEAIINSIALDAPDEEGYSKTEVIYKFSATAPEKNANDQYHFDLTAILNHEQVELPHAAVEFEVLVPFQKKDDFHFLLSFDKAVHMTSPKIIEKINVAGMSYELRLQQVNDYAIEVRSIYEVYNSTIAPTEINDVEAFYEAMRDLTSEAIMFQVSSN